MPHYLSHDHDIHVEIQYYKHKKQDFQAAAPDAQIENQHCQKNPQQNSKGTVFVIITSGRQEQNRHRHCDRNQQQDEQASNRDIVLITAPERGVYNIGKDHTGDGNPDCNTDKIGVHGMPPSRYVSFRCHIHCFLFRTHDGSVYRNNSLSSSGARAGAVPLCQHKRLHVIL